MTITQTDPALVTTAKRRSRSAVQPEGKGSGSHAYVSLKDKMAIAKFLDDVIVKVDDKTCYYKPGYSDSIVASRMDFECTKYIAMGVRRELFGDISVRGGDRSKPGASNTAARLDRLEAAIKRLAVIAGTTPEAFGFTD